MLGTLFSLIISGVILFYPPLAEAILNQALLTVAMIVIGGLFFFLFTLVQAFSWGPLQRAEQNITPRLIDLYFSDGHMKLFNLWFILFPLTSFVMATAAIPYALASANTILAIWLVMLGISFDAFIHLSRRILNYLNPFTVVKLLGEKAINAIKNEEPRDLCHWIEAFGEIGTKAVDSHLPTLCNSTIDSLHDIAKNYLTSAKSISHHYQENKQEHVDQVSYTLFFLFQQMEQIHEHALTAKMEPVCAKLATSLGKIALAAANYDLTMAGYPLHYLGKFALKAQEAEIGDVGEKGTCTLVEAGKAIVEETDIRYQNLNDPFSTLLVQLDNLAKARFRKDKGINITLLTQPFQELRLLFIEGGKGQEHQDAAAIVSQINGILSRFDQLELVLRKVPPLPDLEEEKTR